MDDIVISAEEQGLRARVLQALEDARAPGHAQTISAAAFSRVLSSFKLHFGHPVVDRIMLQCKIGDDGMVDFSRLADDVQLRSRADAHAHTQAPTPSRDSSAAAAAEAAAAAVTGSQGPSSRGYEFRSALEATTGVPLPVSCPPELLSLPQPERVRRLGKHIAALFTKMDTGRMTLDQFRAALSELGIVEPPEVTRLLSQTPLPFSVFFRALQSELPPEHTPTSRVELFRPGSAHASTFSALGTPDGPAFTHRGRKLGPRGSERGLGFNPVTGEGTPEREGDRAAFVSPYNTAVQSNILAVQPRSKAREDHAHMRETGAGAVIFGREPVAKGADVVIDDRTKFDLDMYKKGMGERGRRELYDETGAGSLIHGGSQPAKPDQTFETMTQVAQRTGVYGKDDREHRPYTSAGYRTADHGLIREQVYSAVRQLDAGKLSSRAFREQLAALHIDVTPAVERLVQRYETHGKADFGQFVKAFEEYFAMRTHAATNVQDASEPAAEAPAWGGSAISRDAMLLRDERADLANPVRPEREYHATEDTRTFTHGHTSGGTYFSTHINPLNRGHGDIVGWSTPATTAEHEHKPRFIPNRTQYDTYSVGVDQLTAADHARIMRGKDILSFSSADREYRAPRPRMSENRGSGNITAWAGGDFAPADAAREIAAPGGRARVHTPLADKARVHSAPFARDV